MQTLRSSLRARLLQPLLLALLAGTATAAPPAADLEQVKQSFVELRRDLVILEEDLLFPASSQVAVFLSMDVGEFFSLDAVTLTLDGEDVTHHLYTERQVDALHRGGVQKLFLGNVQQGAHRLTAVFTGQGPEGARTGALPPSSSKKTSSRLSSSSPSGTPNATTNPSSSRS
jgi:hypothetical protein